MDQSKITKLEKIESKLKHLYYKTDGEASLVGLTKFYNYAKKKIPGITVKNVKDFLSKQEAYTLNRDRKLRFLRNPIRVYKVDQQWQADLIDIQRESKFNYGYRYILVVIDILSRYAFAAPLKNKTSTELIIAFSEILSKRKPKIIQMDLGKEFYNKALQNFFEKNNIEYFYS
ncbi:hypothetical protein B4U80_06891, partial [Leptotrombidium deliense]